MLLELERLRIALAAANGERDGQAIAELEDLESTNMLIWPWALLSSPTGCRFQA
jgi:hypothetical protein